jgi:hypothetical protein
MDILLWLENLDSNGVITIEDKGTLIAQIAALSKKVAEKKKEVPKETPKPEPKPEKKKKKRSYL